MWKSQMFFFGYYELQLYFSINVVMLNIDSQSAVNFFMQKAYMI